MPENPPAKSLFSDSSDPSVKASLLKECFLDRLQSIKAETLDPSFDKLDYTDEKLESSQVIIHLIHDRTVRESGSAFNYKGFAAQVQVDQYNFVQENLIAKLYPRALIEDVFTITQGRKFTYAINIVCCRTDYVQKLRRFVQIIPKYIKVTIHTVAMGVGLFNCAFDDAIKVLKGSNAPKIRYFVHDPQHFRFEKVEGRDTEHLN